MKITKTEPDNNGRNFLRWKGSCFSWVEEQFASTFESAEDAKLVADSFPEVKDIYCVVSD